MGIFCNIPLLWCSSYHSGWVGWLLPFTWSQALQGSRKSYNQYNLEWMKVMSHFFLLFRVFLYSWSINSQIHYYSCLNCHQGQDEGQAREVPRVQNIRKHSLPGSHKCRVNTSECVSPQILLTSYLTFLNLVLANIYSIQRGDIPGK